MCEVPVQDFLEIASHKVTHAPHNLWVHSQSKCIQIQSILTKCESQKLHNVPEQTSKDLWACKIIKRGQSIFTKCWSQECLFARHINRENVPTTFLSILQAETFQNTSELHSKQLRFWTHKLWDSAQNFFCKACRQITCKMCVNFSANSYVFGHINRENLSRTFSVNLGGRELPKCVWTSLQTVFVFGRTNRVCPELFS